MNLGFSRLLKIWAKIAMVLALGFAGHSYSLPVGPKSKCDPALSADQVAQQSQVTAQEFEATLERIQKDLKDPKVGVFGPDSMMWKVFRERPSWSAWPGWVLCKWPIRV